MYGKYVPLCDAIMCPDPAQHFIFPQATGRAHAAVWAVKIIDANTVKFQ